MKKLLLSDLRYSVGLLIVLAIVITVVWNILNANTEATDNAIVRCEITDVVSEVEGTIEGVYFKDDQTVTKGEVLINLNDDLQVAEQQRVDAELDRVKSMYELSETNKALIVINARGESGISEAALQSAQSALEIYDHQIASGKSQLLSAEKELANLKSIHNRNIKLDDQGFISKAVFNDSLLKYEAKLAAVEGLKSDIQSLIKSKKRGVYDKDETSQQHLVATKREPNVIAAAEVEMVVAGSAYKVAKANRDLAAIELSRMTIKALRNGKITNRRVYDGQYIQIGQPVASIVSCDERAWIEANFKETQIGKMREGDRATFTIDTYPGEQFEGVLSSISSGSGDTFSVLPAENATGNFTKIVKRFPVLIDIPKPHKFELRTGMSVAVKVENNGALARKDNP